MGGKKDLMQMENCNGANKNSFAIYRKADKW